MLTIEWHDNNAEISGAHTNDDALYAVGWIPPRYPVPAIPDNHEYLARKLGTMSANKWIELWEWSNGEWFASTL